MARAIRESDEPELKLINGEATAVIEDDANTNKLPRLNGNKEGAQ